MKSQLVTCPETGKREEIDCISARDGEVLVVLRCSRFSPPDAMVCAANCVHDKRCALPPDDRWRIP